MLGRVQSDHPARIHYCLTIEPHGHPGASPTLAEIGDVDVNPNEPAEFGHTLLPLRAGTEVDAHLVISWDGGKMECGLAPIMRGEPTSGRQNAAPGPS